MLSLTLDNRPIDYHNLPDFIEKKPNEDIAHVYDLYSSEAIDRLYVLDNITKVSHVVLGFKNEQIDAVLKHINIFNNLTFTLIPELVTAEVYDRIYNFFFHCDMSVSYITWVSFLMFRAASPQMNISIDTKSMDLGKCDALCPLTARNCNKSVVFFMRFHPLFGEDALSMPSFCDIHRQYSYKIVETFTKSSMKELEITLAIRKNMKIGSQYWIDPLKIFS